MANVMVIDTETPGFKKPLRPIELATLFFTGDDPRQLVPGESHHSYHYVPAHEFEFGALSVHNILPSTVENAPNFIAPSFHREHLSGVDYLIGHNVDFDWEVIGKPDIKRICTLAICRYYWPELDAHKLGAMMYFLFGLTEDTRNSLVYAHSALADAGNCYNILHKIVNSKGVDTWSRLYGISELGRIPHRMTFGKYGPKNGEKGMKIQEMVAKDPGYVKWLKNNVDDLDPYLRKALG